MNRILIVSLLHQQAEIEEEIDAYSRPLESLYIISQSLPFVFEVNQSIFDQGMDEKYIEKRIDHLKDLRRIRIVQSLKSRDSILNGLNNKYGEGFEKGHLEITFKHPLFKNKQASNCFNFNFKQNKEEIFSLIHIGNKKDPKTWDNEGLIEFPDNCSIITLKMIRKGFIKSFTSLVWFNEPKLKSSKIYYCAVKLDSFTKVSLFFIVKQNMFAASLSFN